MAGIIGIVALAMYGDRSLFYQDPYSYIGGYTKLTPLGESQQLQLGTFLRSHYLNPNSPDFINGISPELVNDRQIKVRVDNGGEQGVIGDSAVSLLQGLFPPNTKSRTYLANGTTVVGPFGGYQYVPVESVEPEQSIQLEGWTKCPAFEKHVKGFYDSPEFKKKAKEAQPFLDEAKQYLFGIPNTLENIYNVYDYMKVNFIHNETYAFKLPPTFLAQAQAWADYHEHGVFTSKKGDGVGNIAGRTILPSIIHYLERIADERDPLRLALQEISYKPFISLFNLTGLDERYPDIAGIPNYGSALVFEVRLNDENEAYLRTKFKNGTADDDFRTLRLFGHKEDIALNEFLYRLDLSAIHSVNEWCKTCGQKTERGCSVCNTDFAPSIPQIAGEKGEKEPIRWGQLLEQLWDEYYFAVFSGIAFAVTYVIIKFWRSRRPQLQGYDPLPTTTQPYRDEPPAKRYRF